MTPAPLAYIDPGILSAATQGLLALLFAILTGYVLAPWRWIRSFFRRSDPPPAAKTVTVPPANGPGPT